MTTLLAPEQRVGLVLPRVAHVPAAASRAAASEAARLAASAGLVLDPWQEWALEQALGERDDGTWAAGDVCLVVARQNGKGAILEARELFGLFLGRERIVHTAHEFKTATAAHDRLWALIESTPDLRRYVKQHLRNTTEMSITLHAPEPGAREPKIQFIARSKSSGRGLSADTLILDEAMILSDTAVSALLPTLSSSANPQIWYTGSAPMADAVSDVLRRVCRRGRKGEGSRLCYLEWSAPEDAALDDPAALEAANPALSVARAGELNREHIEEVERPSMTAEAYALERLSIFPTDEDASSLIKAHDWSACRSKAKPRPDGTDPGWMLDPVCFGVDTTPDRAWSSIGAAGDCRDGGVALEVIDHRPGTLWVVDRVIELVERHGPKWVVIDPRSPAGSFIQELRNALEADGRKVIVEATTGKHVQACGLLLDDIVGHRVAHRGQPELDAAVAGATTRPVGDAWLWDRKAGVVITPLVAAGLARWGHQLPPEEDEGEDVVVAT